jgi:hypothetical protein
MFKTTRKQAQRIILDFSRKYEGREIVIAELSKKELYAFILTDTYLHVDHFLKDVNVSLDRAIERADYFKAENYVTYLLDNKDARVRIL